MALRVKHSAIVSLGSDLGIAVCKAILAWVSGSSALISEAVHSAVDCINSAFLIVGERARHKEPDREHPVGYGREAYFWTLLAAMSMFAAGGTISAYEGIARLLHPRSLHYTPWTYVVLAVAAVFEAYAFVVAYREHRRGPARAGRGVWDAFRETKDLTTYAVLFENGAALFGVAIAFAGILGSRLTQTSYPDGAASLTIGLLLTGVAFVLARESRGLIIGESVGPRIEERMRDLAEESADVEEVLRLFALHAGPHHVIVAMDVRFRPALTAANMVEVVDAIESRLRKHYPDVKQIFIEADRLVKATR